jgi:hypothetical protein
VSRKRTEATLPRNAAYCYWAIIHSGSKIAVQPSTDNVTMHIIAAPTERGRSLLLSASSGATE